MWLLSRRPDQGTMEKEIRKKKTFRSHPFKKKSVGRYSAGSGTSTPPHLLIPNTKPDSKHKNFELWTSSIAEEKCWNNFAATTQGFGTHLFCGDRQVGSGRSRPAGKKLMAGGGGIYRLPPPRQGGPGEGTRGVWVLPASGMDPAGT